jgi:hypothetical protein
MSSAQGRFTSPDPEGASASLFDPQRWSAYSYAVNNPYKFVDPDGEVPVLLVTAGIGAGVGALGGAVFDVADQLIQNGGDFSAIDGREVAGAAIGGAVSGGIAGLTLGLIPAPAVLTTGYLVTTAVVSGGANAVGGVVQRSVDPNASGSVAGDFATGAIGGAVGTKVAYVRYPLPNVKKELAIIANSNRRSLREEGSSVQSVRESADGSKHHCRRGDWYFGYKLPDRSLVRRDIFLLESEIKARSRKRPPALACRLPDRSKFWQLRSIGAPWHEALRSIRPKIQ